MLIILPTRYREVVLTLSNKVYDFCAKPGVEVSINSAQRAIRVTHWEFEISFESQPRCYTLPCLR